MGEQRYLYKHYVKEKEQSPKKKKETPEKSIPPPKPVTLQEMMGNQEICHMFESGLIQAKLYVSQAGDRAEQQADRIADQVVGNNSSGSGKLPVNQIRENQPGLNNNPVSQNIQSRIESLKQGGNPLQKNIRDYFRPRFGVDMDFVRIHTNNNADRLARAIQARAFVSENHIVFAKGEYKPDTVSGKKLIAHELTHVLQHNSPVLYRQQQIEISRIIRDAYANFTAGIITMPDLARVLIPFAQTWKTDILSVFDSLPEHHRDNLAFAMASNSTDQQLIFFAQDILARMMLELDKWTSTTHHAENGAQRDRIRNLISPYPDQARYGAIANLDFLRSTFNNNITASVGAGGANTPPDVQHIAGGLSSRGYSVPDISRNRGICTPEFVSTIKQFQQNVMHIPHPDGRIDPKGTTLQTLFNKQNNSYSSGLQELYGRSDSILNQMLEGNPLDAWSRTTTFDATANHYTYSINTASFIDRTTYDNYIRTISRHRNVGVTQGSDIDRALGVAARAARDEQFFNALTKNVSFELVLSDRPGGMYQVNSILLHRMRRYHKFLSAVGLFRGNMRGSAVGDPVYRHRVCVSHVVMCGKDKNGKDIQSPTSKQSIRNNLISVYNGTPVAGGRKNNDNSIVDADGYVWARPEHFVTNEEGTATAMKDSTWFPHLKTIQSGRNWDTLTAEGYEKGNSRRFPLGLNADPGRSNHILGDAMDINKDDYVNKNDSINDLIALYFGVMRPVPREHWHFECTNLALSASETALIRANNRESIVNQ